MQILDQKYIDQLETIKGAIQSSELLTTYLDDEEEESYQVLRVAFEPQIEAVYEQVAANDPLQLVSFEEQLLVDDFEGLYLSKILGYSVLRGEVNELYKYKRPQNHFKKIVIAICHSSNFDMISQRIGQGVQLGFGLSSHIWITNLIETIEFKRVQTFLQEQVLDKYRDPVQRQAAYNKYRRQFSSINYYSAEFPATLGELKVMFSSLLNFLKLRVTVGTSNESLVPFILEFLKNDTFKKSEEYVQLLHIFCNYYDNAGHEKLIKTLFNDQRAVHETFNEDYFAFHKTMLESDLHVTTEADKHLFDLIDRTIDDDLTKYYSLMDVIHTKGYTDDDSIEAVRVFCDQHEGLSIINECVRRSTLSHFKALMADVTIDDVTVYFEMNKVFAVYIQIFGNQQFNLSVKKLSLTYITKLLKSYTDKRGKDYQEIKKFVTHTFLDFGFMKEKELVELFKTKRKKKKPV